MTQFITKDSGERNAYESGMIREPGTFKARFDLLVAAGVPHANQFLTRCAELLTRGAVKYAARNWERANSQTELDDFKAAAFRHFMQWMADERDEDHAAAVFFNLLGYETTLYKISQEPPQPPSDKDIEAWINANPQWFATWVRKQNRINGRRAA